jgi:hypothetical protein
VIRLIVTWAASFVGAVFCVLLLARAMNNENEKGREHDLRQRIVSLIRANEQALKKPITDEEVQTLKAAAARLDQLLEDIATGKDVPYDLKRRRNWQKREDG